MNDEWSAGILPAKKDGTKPARCRRSRFFRAKSEGRESKHPALRLRGRSPPLRIAPASVAISQFQAA
jgi:hypothetical protein